MEPLIGILTIRAINAALWSAVVIRILRRDRPVSTLARRMICLVIGIGMWMLVVGGVTPFGFPSDIARNVYTIYTAFAGLVATTLLSVDD